MSDIETIKELRTALQATAAELAVMKQQFGDAAQEKSRKAAERQVINNQLILDTSERGLATLDSDIAATIDTLRVVAAASVQELGKGFTTNRAESVTEVRRLTSHLGDILLLRAVKQWQHEALVSRLGPSVEAAPPKVTSFEAAYYTQPNEGEPPIEAA